MKIYRRLGLDKFNLVETVVVAEFLLEQGIAGHRLIREQSARHRSDDESGLELDFTGNHGSREIDNGIGLGLANLRASLLGKVTQFGLRHGVE